MLTMRPAQAVETTPDDAPEPITQLELDAFIDMLDDAPDGDDPHADPEIVVMLAAIDAELRAHRSRR